MFTLIAHTPHQARGGQTKECKYIAQDIKFDFVSIMCTEVNIDVFLSSINICVAQ